MLRDYGMKLPGAHLKSPWPGHKDLAVNDKTLLRASALRAADRFALVNRSAVQAQSF